MIKEYTPENIRNISIIGHGGVGKTTLIEHALYISKAIEKKGTIEGGTTVSDFEEEEISHKLSVHNSLSYTEYLDTKLNLIDTPGMPDFVGEVRAALRVSEGALVVVDSVEGMQMGTKKIWQYADEYKVPRIIFVNKLDKEESVFEKLLEKLRNQLDFKIVPIELPIGEGEGFKGIIDLVSMKALYPNESGSGVYIKKIPKSDIKRANKYREELSDIVADIDEKLVNKVLSGEGLTNEEILQGIMELTQSFKIVPLICGSAKESIGILTLLKMMVSFLPSPIFVGETIGYNPKDMNELVAREPLIDGPLAAFVYKTRIDQYSGKFSYFRMRSGTLKKDDVILNPRTGEKEKILHIYSIMGNKQIEVPKIIAGDMGAIGKLDNIQTGDTLSDLQDTIMLPPLKLPSPIYFKSVQSDNKANTEKMITTFNRLEEEDPTFKVQYDDQTKETIIGGMGETQVKILINKVEKKNNLEVKINEPQIAYKETIKAKAEAKYKHKKQTGGHGQYGEVYLRLEPLGDGKHFEFINNIVGGAIPKNYIPGVEKGILEAMAHGVLASYPVTGVRVTLYDGTFHSVDSSELAFKVAGFHAMKLALENARPMLLEPIANLEIDTSEELVGTIMGDIQGRRGKIIKIDTNKKEHQMINAKIPYVELANYATEFRSLTKDQATFSITPSHYEPLVGKLAEQIINTKNLSVET